jgi:hypothetical protein
MTADHARVSERLATFLSEELDDHEAEEIRAHLKDCSACSRELKALEALARAEPAPLDDLERERLHRALRGAVAQRGASGAAAPVQSAPRSPDRGEASPSTTHERPRPADRRRRLAPALAAAALVLVGAVAVATTGLMSGDDSGSDAALSGSADESAEQLDAAGDGADRRRLALKPSFDPRAGELSRADLGRLGRSSFDGASLESAYSNRSGNGGRLVSRLAALAPREAVADVRRCTQAIRAERGSRLVPVRGALGTLDGVDVLVLGFLSAQGDSRRLDRLDVWAWARGDCREPVAHTTERLQK